MYFCDEHRGITRYYEILKSSVCEKYQLRQMEYDILHLPKLIFFTYG